MRYECKCVHDSYMSRANTVSCRGGTAGHGVATGLAVLTGDLIGDYLSEKVVAYAGGALFISFAVGTLFEIFEKLS